MSSGVNANIVSSPGSTVARTAALAVAGMSSPSTFQQAVGPGAGVNRNARAFTVVTNGSDRWSPSAGCVSRSRCRRYAAREHARTAMTSTQPSARAARGAMPTGAASLRQAMTAPQTTWKGPARLFQPGSGCGRAPAGLRERFAAAAVRVAGRSPAEGPSWAGSACGGEEARCCGPGECCGEGSSKPAAGPPSQSPHSEGTDPTEEGPYRSSSHGAAGRWAPVRGDSSPDPGDSGAPCSLMLRRRRNILSLSLSPR